MVSRIAISLLVVTLCGCVVPQDYRVLSKSGEPYLLPPNTQETSDYESRGSQVSVDVLDVITEAAFCKGTDDPTGLSVQVIDVVWRTHLTRSLRFTGDAHLFTTRADLSSAYDKWAPSEAGKQLIACAGVDASAARRSLLAQRPMSGKDSLEEQLGFRGSATEPSATGLLRTTVLRPGMSVCAADVAADRTDSGLRIAGTSCARIVGAPDGGSMFDPAIGRMNNLQSGAVGFKSGINRVGGWAEIQRPNNSPMVFVLVEPRDLPANIDSVNPPVATGPTILIGVVLADHQGNPPLGLQEILGKSTAISDQRVQYICGKLDDVVCYSLGERSVITATFQITVNARTLDVGVGTTVGDVLDQVAPDLFALDLMGSAGVAESADPAAKGRLMDTLVRLRMDRVFEGRLVRVQFPSDIQAVVRLPLQPGDRFTW